MKAKTKTSIQEGLFGAIALTLIVGSIALSDQKSPIIQEEFEECANKIARQAYIEDDVGNTFDAGFDAGVFAANWCQL